MMAWRKKMTVKPTKMSKNDGLAEEMAGQAGHDGSRATDGRSGPAMTFSGLTNDGRAAMTEAGR